MLLHATPPDPATILSRLLAGPPALMQVGPNPSPQQPSDLPVPRRTHVMPAAPVAPVAADGGTRPADRLDDCMTRARRDSAAGLAYARGWLAEGATPGARVRANQCLGLILTDRGDFAGAEQAFSDAVAGIPAAQAISAVPLLAMAGNAALAGGKPTEALQWFDRGLGVRGYQDKVAAGAIQTDRARALVALGRFAEAGTALEEARRLAPNDPAGWLLSATLARRARDLAAAQREIETAVLLDPKDPAIGLEAGVVAVLAGHDEAARRSWMSVLTIAPDSPEAKTARGYLEQIGPGPTSPQQQSPQQHSSEAPRP